MYLCKDLPSCNYDYFNLPVKEHEHEFDKLISDVKNRQRGKRKKTAKEIPGK